MHNKIPISSPTCGARPGKGRKEGSEVGREGGRRVAARGILPGDER